MRRKARTPDRMRELGIGCLVFGGSFVTFFVIFAWALYGKGWL